MAKVLSEARLTTRSARAALCAGLHWRAIDPEIHLGYRKGPRGGRWLVRWYAGHQKYRQEALGVADDVLEAGTLSYEAAHKAAKAAVEAARKIEVTSYADTGLTVRTAIEEYIAERDRRITTWEGRKVRSDASRKLTRHLLKDEKLPSIPLSKLTEDDLSRWLSRVDPKLKQTSRQRLASDTKAALNRIQRRMRKALPPDFADIVRFGLKVVSNGELPEPLARDNQILSDDQVRSILTSVAELDRDGDFTRLVILLAATGARFSQVARLQVRDVQPDRSRILMPSSRKGRERAASFTPIPVGTDVLTALAPILADRDGEERLLVRWRYSQVSVTDWVRVSREHWKTPSEMLRPWHKACAAISLGGTVPYALRHSSIVRAIRNGLPIRLVAALHDTSVLMIERHYGRWIADGLEEIASRAVIPLLEAA